MGLVLYAILLLLFASFCTCHIWLCVLLLRRDIPRGLVGLVIFPLAPYFALAKGLRGLPAAWVALGSLYLIGLVLALVLPESF